LNVNIDVMCELWPKRSQAVLPVRWRRSVAWSGLGVYANGTPNSGYCASCCPHPLGPVSVYRGEEQAEPLHGAT
jgi:hypothetical protein